MPYRYSLIRRRAISRARRLAIQQLEPRNLLATFTVSTLADESDGNFSDGDQSLREAVERANVTFEADTINFKSGLTGTIGLGGSGLVISKDLTINGPGADKVTVNGSGQVRVFSLSDNFNAVFATIAGLTITGGSAIGFGGAGGGIAADAGSDLTLNRVRVTNNIANQGGGVSAINAQLTILNSTIDNNFADSGGGIHQIFETNNPADPALRIINSTIAFNAATIDAGGGVYVQSGAALMRNCTVALNSAETGGGGIGVADDGSAWATIFNTIVAGNTSFGSTLASDIANHNVDRSSANNLVGDAASAGGLFHGPNGNIVGNGGSGTMSINSILDPAFNSYGGSTPTLALVTGSLALDAGSNDLVQDLPGDQRGFTRIYDGPDANTTATVDIGAYEATRRTFVVDTLASTDDGNYGAGNLSLREALQLADRNAGQDTVNFVTGLTGTIAGSYSISDALLLNGPGADLLTIDAGGFGRVLTIVSMGTVRISDLTFKSGNTGDNEDLSDGGGGILILGGGGAMDGGLEIPAFNTQVVLQRMAIRDNVGRDGGGVMVWGAASLTVISSTIAGNQANLRGGGIGIVPFDDFDTSQRKLVMLNSTIENNTALGGGGVVAVLAPYPGNNDVHIINSTISGNKATADVGGGVAIGSGTAVLRNSTVTGNRASASGEGGGGIWTGFDGATTLFNTIVAGNLRGTGEGTPHDIANVVASESANNLIGSAGSAGELSHGVNGNIVGNNGTGTIDINTVLNKALTDNGGLTRTHLLKSGGLAIDKGSNSLALDQNDAALTTDQRGSIRIVDNDGNGTATVDIGAVELLPFTLSLSGTITYTESEEPLILASGATLSALDSKTFDTGKLTVTNAVGPHADDRLIVRHEGVGAGQVSTNGSEVSYGGLLIGTKTGGSGATPLIVTFHGSATAAAVQAVARRVAFSSTSNNPPTAGRSIRFVVRDGEGAATNAATKTVNVVRVNDAPVIGSFGSAVTYTEDTPAIGIAVLTTVSDADSFNYDGGKLSARISAGAESTDRLSIRNLGSVSTSGSEVIAGGEVVGTFAGGGSTALVVTFNVLANSADVQAVLRALTFRSFSQNPSATPRTLSIFVTDGVGGTSATATKSINVTPVNDKPVLGGISGSVGYARDSAAIFLAGSATVTDADNANFADGRLRVRTTDGASSSNRLAIGGGFTVDANSNVLLGGTIIGKRTANGFGTSELIVTFNSSATKAIVQQLARAITFKTVGGAIGARKVLFTISDGDGGISAEATKTVNVT